MSEQSQLVDRVKEQYADPDSDIGEDELEVAIGILEDIDRLEGTPTTESEDVIESFFGEVSFRELVVGACLAMIWPLFAGSLLALHGSGVKDFEHLMDELLGGILFWGLGAMAVGLALMPVLSFLGV